MNLSTTFRRSIVFTSLVGLSLLGAGCGMDSNEKEFLESAPPGKPSEFPNETFKERRQRVNNAEVVKKNRGKSAAPKK